MIKIVDQGKRIIAHHDLLVFVLLQECEEELEPSLSWTYYVSLHGLKVINVVHIDIVSENALSVSF